MNCPVCNTPLDDDSRFCVSCGTNLDTCVDSGADTKPEVHTTPQPLPLEGRGKVRRTANPEKRARRIRLIVGTFFILVGLLRVLTAGTSISSTSFGADFYTYRGIVAVTEMLASIEVTLGWLVAAIGAAIDVSALRA